MDTTKPPKVEESEKESSKTPESSQKPPETKSEIPSAPNTINNDHLEEINPKIQPKIQSKIQSINNSNSSIIKGDGNIIPKSTQPVNHEKYELLDFTKDTTPEISEKHKVSSSTATPATQAPNNHTQSKSFESSHENLTGEEKNKLSDSERTRQDKPDVSKIIKKEETLSNKFQATNGSSVKDDKRTLEQIPVANLKNNINSGNTLNEKSNLSPLTNSDIVKPRVSGEVQLQKDTIDNQNKDQIFIDKKRDTGLSFAKDVDKYGLENLTKNTFKLGKEKAEIGIEVLLNEGTNREIIDITMNIIKSKAMDFGTYKTKYNWNLKVGVENRTKIVDCFANNIIKDTLGLKVSFDQYSIYLKGTPNEGYDDRLILNVKFVSKQDPNIDTILKSDKEFYIASDPKKMWKDLEVTEEEYDGYFTKNDEKQAFELKDIAKIVIAASCRGRSHAHIGKPRDDNFYIVSDDDSGWNVLAVSDGAGSARYSRKGSDIACKISVDNFLKVIKQPEIMDIFDEDILKQWKNNYTLNIDSQHNLKFEEYRNKFKKLDDNLAFNVIQAAYKGIFDEAIKKKDEANKNKDEEDKKKDEADKKKDEADKKKDESKKEVTIHDYNATLLFLAFKKFSFGYFFISYWIGDGAVVIYNWNREYKLLLLGTPDSGEFAGQTKFLTMKSEVADYTKILPRIFYSFADDFDAVILATDGITDAFFPSEQNLIDYKKWNFFWNKILKIGHGDNEGSPEIFDSSTSLDEKATSLRNWLDFWSIGNHDDRTIVIVKDR